ncbi:hypothetical protein [Companilactobacillus heilongjiangensis]|uniref:Surface layer protein A domain-containing protein n=1 Tax=Companilactobacillus heilongjiangensis TaxID=1074467 RepID=A0A0K2LDV0_9LACO|nr:hypothetical protein [Companilactobacillus heilongjiangensis]ALB29363.1 hypothetical protein JP39_08345 [Companilactobacillus heilongjiangensis]
MKKITTFLVAFAGLLFGALSLANTTTVKADSPLPAGRYSFAVTNKAQTNDMQGNVTSTVLDAGSVWKINSEYTHGDQTFFELAPNILVNQSAGYMYLPSVGTLTISSKTAAPLYDHNGKLITDRALSPKSSWYTDRTIFRDKMTYYRVATDEFVSLGDALD